MDHYRRPRNRGLIDGADFSFELHNPLCGDRIAISGMLNGSTVTQLGHEGAGCVISQAAASLLSDYFLTKTIDEIMHLDAQAICAILGMKLGPTRLKCALLPLEAMRAALKDRA